MRRGLCQLFHGHEYLEVCDEAKNGAEAVALTIRHKPDLVILDFAMPVMDGAQAARAIHELLPEVPIILYTMHAEVLGKTKLPGVARLVSKEAFPEVLKHAEELVPPAPDAGN